MVVAVNLRLGSSGNDDAQASATTCAFENVNGENPPPQNPRIIARRWKDGTESSGRGWGRCFVWLTKRDL